MSPKEQRLYLQDFRRNWDFESELEASKLVGGPELLVVARARAAPVNPDSPLNLQVRYNEEKDTTTPSVDSTKNRRVRSFLKKLGRSTKPALPTIRDSAGSDEGSIDDMDTTSLKRGFSGISLDSALEDSEGGPATSIIGISGILSGQDGTRRKVLQQIVRLSSRDSLEMQEVPSETDNSLHKGYNSQLSKSFKTALGGRPTGSTLGGSKFVSFTRSQSIESDKSLSEEVSDPMQPYRSYDLTDSAIVDMRQAKDARMDRMESLLERLIIFSSEQALQTRGTDRSSRDGDQVAVLLKEVGELREEVISQKKESKAAASSEEIELLRKEIEELKAQINNITR